MSSREKQALGSSSNPGISLQLHCGVLAILADRRENSAMHRKERKKNKLEREMCNLGGRGSGAGTGPGATVTARTGPRQGLKAPGAALPGTEPSLWPDTAQEPLGRREMFIRPCQVPGLGRKGKGWERREDPHSELG